MPRATIREIARLAGVSIGTVDRVVNDRGNVREETRERVRRVCASAGYESNSLAKALARRKKELRVAVAIAPPEWNLFTRSVKDGFDAVAEQVRDYNIHFDYAFPGDGSAGETEAFLDSLSGRPPDGLIIKPFDAPSVRDRLEALRDGGMPVITCTSDISNLDVLCFVGQDHAKEGRIAANMLSAQCAGPVEAAAIINPRNIQARTSRFNGFLGYLRGHRPDINLVEVLEVGGHPDAVFAESYGLLKRHPGIGALYAHTSSNPSVLKALDMNGLRGKVKAFTFGSREENEEYLRNGQLSFVIAEEPFQHGVRAGTIMFEHLFHRKQPEAKRVLLPAQILIPESL